MIKLNKPEFNQKQILLDCISNMRETSSKERIQMSMDEIVENSFWYDTEAKNGKLLHIKVHEKLSGGATKEDMKNLYERKFVPAQQPGRKYYDAIMLLANYKCPYCGQRVVSTLDHYLPKSLYPIFAVTPYNLIPSCKDCNWKKQDDKCSKKETQIIHPYYDDFYSEKWIVAKMIEGEPIAFNYEVKCPSNWDSVKQMRAKHHFEQFELNDLYKAYAAEEYMSCFIRILRLYKKGGKNLAIEDLKDNIESRDAIRLNTWQSAMYQAIIDNEWYWEEYMKRQL